MIKGKVRGIISCFFIVIALTTMLAGQAAQGMTLEQEYIPITRWVCPLGTQPITFEEWKQGQPLPVPFAVEEICRRDHIMRELTFLGLEPPLPSAQKVAIIVNSTLRPLIQPSLDQYVTNLAAEGWAPTIHSITGGTPASLRAHLQGLPGLVGAVLIGDLPVPWFEMFWAHFGWTETFPLDLYYMDLDGAWTDADGDGRYDEHSDPDGAGPKDMTPEIWVGRLTAGPLTGDEATLVNDYFTRNHNWRQGLLPTNNRALVYVDDDWEHHWAEVWDGNVGLLYDVRTFVQDRDTTIASDYKARLVHNYEWISVFVHSSATRHAFETPAGSAAGGHVTFSDIQTLHPVATFYNLFACSNARFVETDYMGGWYIFAGDHGLAAIGSTKTGSMLNFQYFYGPLGQGKTLGEAFQEWFTAIYPFALGGAMCERGWHYGMTLLGDPTLRPILAEPVLGVTPTTITGSVVEGTTTWTNIGTITIANPGGGTLSWSETDPVVGIDVWPSEGTVPAGGYATTNVWVRPVRPDGTVDLPPGNHTAIATFVGASPATGSPDTVTITVTVASAVVRPTVETRPATSVTQTGARLNARITCDGGAAIIGRSFAYRIVGDAHWRSVGGTDAGGGYFTYHATGLIPGTTYEFKASASNAAGSSGWTPTRTFTTAPPPPVLSVDPPSLAFGNVTIGEIKVLNFQVTNTGGGALIGNTSVSAPFSIIIGEHFNVPAGQTRAVSVGFSPTVAGEVSRTVSFTSNAGNLTRTVSGRGVALPAISVTPPSLSFGDVTVGQSKNLTFTVANTGGGTLTGSASLPVGPFSIVGGSPFGLTAGASAPVTIRFSPTAAGAVSDMVAFTSNGGHLNRAVSGVGVIKEGDLNNDGEVSIPDVILCLRMTIDLPVTIEGETHYPPYPQWLIERADMNADGEVSIPDVILILRKTIGA